MADNTLTCEIVTPVKTVFASEATYVGLPGEIGSFGVMQRHEPLVQTTLAGVEKELAALSEGDSSTAYLKGQKEWLELQLKTVNA